MNKLRGANKAKEILIILDGMSEEKIPDLNNMTPLEYAYTPALDEIMERAACSKEIFYPPGKSPDSLNCILTILGVEPGLLPRNRAYLEALASGIEVNTDNIVMRCNLVALKDKNLFSFNGGALRKEEMRKAALKVKRSDKIGFHHMSSYRNLLILKKSRQLMELKDLPPHENLGMRMDLMLEHIKKIKDLYKFVLENKFVLDDIEYMFYPWGVAEAAEIPSFYDLHKKSSSLICSAEIVKGIGRAMDMKIVGLKNASGDVDTDLGEKASALLDEAKKSDLVVCHINGTDEAAHRKDCFGKVKFIERIDRELIAPIFKNISKDTKIIILSDHQTSSITGKHQGGPVDLISYGMYKEEI